MKVENLSDLFSLVLQNPKLAKYLKDDPNSVADMFGISLSEAEAKAIRSDLDVNLILAAATEADTMAAKVAQGIGLIDRTK